MIKPRYHWLTYPVYLLSAQFPGPTAPRDFVTMLLTSDKLPPDIPSKDKPLRHFMVISRPCLHKDTAPRDGYVRGQYESVEYIREVPITKPRQMSASMTDLKSMTNTGRNSTLGKDILQNAIENHTGQMDEIDGFDDERAVSDSGLSHHEDKASRRRTGNPVEWIMITRSDPGGSVPRFMVERGTPGSIIADASKFLDWITAKDITDVDSDEETPGGVVERKAAEQLAHDENEKYLRNFQAYNGPEARGEPTAGMATREPQDLATRSGLLEVVDPGAEDGYIPSNTPAVASNHISVFTKQDGDVGRDESLLHHSNSSASSVSSDLSFASALEVNEEDVSTNTASTDITQAVGGIELRAHELKRLNKLDKKRMKLDEKLNKAREKDASKRSGDNHKDEEALRKAEEKHRKEIERIEWKKKKELLKAGEKKRKNIEKDEKARILKELEGARTEVSILRMEKESLKIQVAELKAANKALAENGRG
jgi:hypothetical protein